ncbi:MAG: hypothetical protein HGB06_11995 [Chlorobaculum sp.]|nr:hypothetical protein [Chlorobaculum sp.]
MPKYIRLASLPPYAPELNPVEHLRDELREKALGNEVFESIDAPEEHLEPSLKATELKTPRVWPIVE